MIIQRESSIVRHFERGVFYYPLPYRGLKSIKPLNSIKRYGKGHFVSEVKQLIEAERRARGYYPPLDEIISIIEREFGAEFARDSRITRLPYALRLHGVCYSEAGAAAFHAAREGGQPLLDMSAAYALPWGNTGNYLMWKLPRLPVGEGFVLNRVTIRRTDYGEFSIIAGGVRRSAWSEDLHDAVVRVLMVLRGDNPAAVNPVEAAPVRGRKPAPVRVTVKPAPVTVRRSAPVPALPALPALVYSSTDERRALAVEYTAKGYSMAAIQAALVRADLANGSQDTVQ